MTPTVVYRHAWFCPSCEVGGADAVPRCWCCGSRDVERGSILSAPAAQRTRPA